jgi:predicted DsbA family dithiol-disulfide isomerase
MTEEHKGHHEAHSQHKKHGHRKEHAHAAHKQHKTKHAHKKAHEHPKRHAKPKTNYTPWIVCGALAIVIIILLAGKANDNGSAPSGGEGTADVNFYVMSQCPYGVQVEDAIAPVLEELGDSVNFRLDFIAQEAAGGRFNSLHGEPEVIGDKIQLCVQEHYPEELIGFVTCQNKDYQDLVGSIGKCADDVGIDADTIKDCYQGEEGTSLLSESVKNSEAVNAQGSPTIYIGGKQYQSGRDAASFKRAICAELDSHPSCESMPACGSDADCNAESGKIGVCENPGKSDARCVYKDDAAVTLTVLNAKECSSCDTAQLINVFNQLFLNMEVKEIDASSSAGKKMISDYNLEKAPSYVFTGDFADTYSWQNNAQLKGAFTKKGGAYVVTDAASGSSYILDPEERAEMEKLVGVTKGDNRPQIDFYVMSYCPYGNQAEEGIEPVYQLLGDKADFNPHYVIYSNYQGGGPNYCLDDESRYCSMHGVQELNQGLRELCVDKYMGSDAYFEFVLEMNKKCNYQNADSCWEPVADDLGLDIEKIKDCEADEWEGILSKELQLNTALGVRGSPTIFVEGEPYSGARTPAGYGGALCAAFDSAPGECNSISELEGSASAAPVASGGGCGG